MRPMATLAGAARARRSARSVLSMAAAALMTAEAGLLHFQQQVGHAVLQGLKPADRHANCLRVCRYSSAALLATSMAPSASAHTA